MENFSVGHYESARGSVRQPIWFSVICVAAVGSKAVKRDSKVVVSIGLMSAAF